MPETKQVLVEEKSSSRILFLNRPKQLNALSSEMISGLLDYFLVYEKDPNVKLLILKGNGRAFCAGGDVAAVVRDIREGNWRAGAQFFREEFTLNYLLATASKPQVSLLNGIVMGGGAGVSIHGRFRVATENSVFAMPETALGLFPDIGASYFLSRLPGFFGEYAGLTGSRLDGAEMLAGGLATHFVPSERLSLLEEALIKADSSDPAIISTVINKFATVPNLKKGSAFYRSKIINSCFSRRTVEEIISALEKEAAVNRDDWILSIIHSLRKASPTSLKISLRSVCLELDILDDKVCVLSNVAKCSHNGGYYTELLEGSEIRAGRLEGVGKCLVREYRMVCHVMKGEMSKDFFEGCRAILLDKDRNPKWSPSMLEQVTDDMVDKYFSKIDVPDWEDLKLPPRPNLPAYALAKL